MKPPSKLRLAIEYLCQQTWFLAAVGTGVAMFASCRAFGLQVMVCMVLGSCFCYQFNPARAFGLSCTIFLVSIPVSYILAYYLQSATPPPTQAHLLMIAVFVSAMNLVFMHVGVISYALLRAFMAPFSQNRPPRV